MQSKITEIAEQVAGTLGFLLVDVALKGDNRNRIIEIFIDSPKGVTIDECALMSREVAAVIEPTDLITSKYRLDVSSPGVDRPLKFLAQFPKHLLRKFEIVLNPESAQPEAETLQPLSTDVKPVDKKPEEEKFVGKLIKIEGETLTFTHNNTETDINFNNIKTAKVLISF